MKNLLTISFFFLLVATTLTAQQAKNKKDFSYWDTMMDVELDLKYDPFTEAFNESPTFGKKVAKLDGKKIHLTGYIIPADLTKGRMTLSKFSYSSCYFCGAAGPESVVEIEAKTPIIYRMDKPISIQGTLRLNQKGEGTEYDPFRLLYILEDATYYTED